MNDIVDQLNLVHLRGAILRRDAEAPSHAAPVGHRELGFRSGLDTHRLRQALERWVEEVQDERSTGQQ
jgi:hypothetical protein